jgi:peptide/nickel transport system substrate-binding protein
MKKLRWSTIIVSLIVLSMILSACVKTASPTEITTKEPTAAPTSAPVKNTIIIGVTDTIASLDPADAYSTHDWELIKNTGEGLLKWKPGTAELQLGLAADWPVISADGLTYTFKLREGIKFADGLALTAPSYAEQLNRLLTIGPGETCPNGVASALAVPYVEKIEATDDVTIVFTLKAAIGFFSQILATAPYVPAHPSIFTAASCNLFPTAPVYGVGPWFISQYTQAEQVVFEPNPYYNGELKPQVDQVIIRYFADPQTLSLAVQNGEIDIAWRFMGPELITGLEKIDTLSVGTVDAGPIRYLIINHTFAQRSTAMKSLMWFIAVKQHPCTRWCHQDSWEPPKPSIPCTHHRTWNWQRNSSPLQVTQQTSHWLSISGTHQNIMALKQLPGWK